eukprot:40898-Eustigmatos_ZCMA.PRE.1
MSTKKPYYSLIQDLINKKVLVQDVQSQIDSLTSSGGDTAALDAQLTALQTSITVGRNSMRTFVSSGTGYTIANTYDDYKIDSFNVQNFLQTKSFSATGPCAFSSYVGIASTLSVLGTSSMSDLIVTGTLVNINNNMTVG